MKHRIPQLVLSFVALLIITASFIPKTASDNYAINFVNSADMFFPGWFSVIATFAFVLGGFSLLGSHLKKISERKKDWQYSIVTVSSFILVLIVGFLKIGGEPGFTGDISDPASWLGRVFSTILSPLHATLFSLLAFYIASAAFRSFRIRSLETTVLLISASVIIIGRLPASVQMFSFLPDNYTIDKLSLWLLLVPNTAGQRALMITIALGVVAVALKQILGLGSELFGGKK